MISPEAHPKQVLREFGLEARKSLGQNFLVPGTGEKIARVSGATKNDVVVEIGPGLGALTHALLERGARVIAVDLDRAMVRVLNELFAGQERLTVVEGDGRTVDLGAIARDAGVAKVKLVGNLPYYASSPILRRAIDERAHVSTATFTLQKEVADRIASPPGSKVYGALSVLMQLHADASVPLKLPPGAFHPRPGVDSGVLHLVMRETPRAFVADPAFFEAVVFAAFGQRRKTIWNSLRGSTLPRSEEAIAAALKQASIDPIRRAETLSVEEFAALTGALTAA